MYETFQFNYFASMLSNSVTCTKRESKREAEKDGVFVKDNPTSRDLHQVYFVLWEVFLAFYFFPF